MNLMQFLTGTGLASAITGDELSIPLNIGLTMHGSVDCEVQHVP